MPSHGAKQAVAFVELIYMTKGRKETEGNVSEAHKILLTVLKIFLVRRVIREWVAVAHPRQSKNQAEHYRCRLNNAGSFHFPFT